MPLFRPSIRTEVKRPTFVTPAIVRPALRPPVRPTENRVVPHVTAGHPQENEIPDSVNIRTDVQPNANIPSSVEEDRRETVGARLNLGKYLSIGFLPTFSVKLLELFQLS